MNRLTKKYEGGDVEVIGNEYKAIQKLGKLEDIEDELGCPLDVVFKALKDGILINNKKWWLPRVNLIYMIVDNEYVFICENYSYKLKDYKKTWWLCSDKEDLSE